MRFSSLGLVVAVLFVGGHPFSASAQTAPGVPMGTPIVFFDIAGPDSEAQSRFYREVFGWNIGADGSTTVIAMSPRFEVPGVVVLGLFFDPAGNRMELVEMDGDRAVVPGG
jgi:predicted enzyme related to lactoylglutathione lyase